MQALSGENIERFEAYLKGAASIGVVTHAHPDGDAVGSAVAMDSYLRESLGVQSRIVMADEVPDYLRFLVDGIVPATGLQDCDLVICLDAGRFSRMGELEGALESSAARKVVIDHHPSPDESRFDLCICSTEVSSACELLYEVLIRTEAILGDASRLPLKAAAALMAGMTTDTNNFANSVFPGTLAMASSLLAAGVNRDEILSRLYNECRPNRVAAMSHMLGSRLVITAGGCAYMIMTSEILRRFDVREGETEGLVNIPLTIKEVRLSILLKEDEGHFRVSLRSKEGVAANELASRFFHGGGHARAAGGKLFFPQDIPYRDAAANYVERMAGQCMTGGCGTITAKP